MPRSHNQLPSLAGSAAHSGMMSVNSFSSQLAVNISEATQADQGEPPRVSSLSADRGEPSSGSPIQQLTSEVMGNLVTPPVLLKHGEELQPLIAE